MTLIPASGNLHFTRDTQRRVAHSIDRLSVLHDETGHPLPDDINEVLHAVLQAIAEGEPLSVSSLPEEVTPNTAASMLGLSRTTVMKYVDDGRLHATKVGSHHRIPAREVLALRDEIERKRLDAVFDVMQLEHTMGNSH